MSNIYPSSLRIVYFGSSSVLSIVPFTQLLASEHQIDAIVIDKKVVNSREISLVPENKMDDIESIAIANNVQVLNYQAENSDFASIIACLTPDLIVCSCFQPKIPMLILQIPNLGSLNIHPSLLPKFRGPDPLFWQVHSRVDDSGTTVHIMDADYDRGDVLGQKRLDIKAMVDMASLKRGFAENGGSLLLHLLANIHASLRLAKPQDHQLASYHTFPTRQDFSLLSIWNAEHICWFIKMTENLTPYYLVDIKGKSVKVKKIVTYHWENKLTDSLPPDQVQIPCQQGYVVAEILTV